MKNEKTNDAAIRELKEKMIEALRSKDADGVVAQFADETVMMLLPPPLRFKTGDNAPGSPGIQEWFDTFEGDTLGYDFVELEITADESIAFCHSLDHLVATKKSGEENDLWFRETLGLRKIEGAWKIAHQHQSVPFDMESLQASLDLKPE